MNADVESGPESLDAWHERRGARWREVGERRVVADYGEPGAELEALRAGCGLIEDRESEVLVVSGEDRHRFLNGYLTCDVGSLVTGAGSYGFFTTFQGRILADAVVTADDDCLRVEVAAGRAAPLIEHLSRYILADRVELAAEEGCERWLLAGGGVEEVARELISGISSQLWTSTAVQLAGRRLAISRRRPLGVPLFATAVEAGGAVAAAEALLARGAVPVGRDAIEVLRVETGVPRYGVDFDDAHFPQETGLEDAVSYTKGCYLGQEVVARIHYRGHVNHRLCALRIEGGRRVEPGVVELEGEAVGRLGSVAFSPALGETIGLAILHRRASLGTLVALPNGIAARVEEPGFATPAAVGSTTE